MLAEPILENDAPALCDTSSAAAARPDFDGALVRGLFVIRNTRTVEAPGAPRRHGVESGAGIIDAARRHT